MVMGPDAGGPFAMFYRLARLGLGGTLGPGTQFVSWVHDEDFCRAIEWLITRETSDRAVNVLQRPSRCRIATLCAELRAAAGAPIGLPATRWMLEIGAFFLRTETELPLKSRRVVPTRLVDAGFTFRFPRWPEAVREIVARSR
jgi:NAD dependent epimerase/dehydratase family enzyme